VWVNEWAMFADDFNEVWDVVKESGNSKYDCRVYEKGDITYIDINGLEEDYDGLLSYYSEYACNT
jgi:hypothetical protein